MEENGEWGLINEEVDEEQMGLNGDSILWAESPPPSVMMTTNEPSWDEEHWSDGYYDWVYHTDGEWYTQLEDGVFMSFSELKPWMEIEEISYHDSALGKEISDAFIAVQEKVRTFQEARFAVQQKGKNRGFFKPKGKPKGFGKPKGKGKGTILASFSNGNGKGYGSSSSTTSNIVNTPGYKGCFICGDKSHEFRHCPKRNQGSKDQGSKGSRSVFMVEDVPHVDAPPTSLDSLETTELNGVDLRQCILTAGTAVDGFDRLRYAVLDTGATETVGSMDAIEHVLLQRLQVFGDEHVHIDIHQTKQFRFGNASTQWATSFVHVPQTVGSVNTTLGVYALDVPQIPILLGITTMKRLGAVIDVERSALEFRKLFPGVQVQLIEGRNGHLLLDLCQDWTTEASANSSLVSERQTFACMTPETQDTEEKKGCEAVDSRFGKPHQSDENRTAFTEFEHQGTDTKVKHLAPSVPLSDAQVSTKVLRSDGDLGSVPTSLDHGGSQGQGCCSSHHDCRRREDDVEDQEQDHQGEGSGEAARLCSSYGPRPKGPQNRRGPMLGSTRTGSGRQRQPFGIERLGTVEGMCQVLPEVGVHSSSGGSGSLPIGRGSCSGLARRR